MGGDFHRFGNKITPLDLAKREETYPRERDIYIERERGREGD
jgi:hypothetical protein